MKPRPKAPNRAYTYLAGVALFLCLVVILAQIQVAHSYRIAQSDLQLAMANHSKQRHLHHRLLLERERYLDENFVALRARRDLGMTNPDQSMIGELPLKTTKNNEGGGKK